MQYRDNARNAIMSKSNSSWVPSCYAKVQYREVFNVQTLHCFGDIYCMQVVLFDGVRTVLCKDIVP